MKDIEKKALANFVTDVDGDIYAIKNLPPEIFGAFGSFFSRNPKDFRQHLLDAISGKVKGYEVKDSEKNLKDLAEGNFKSAHSFLESGLAKSRAFFEFYYGKYGHKSIANTVWIPMIASNISQMVAAAMAYDQLAFFIEQSTRYVLFTTDNYYKDPEVFRDKEAGKVYSRAVETLINTYHEFLEIGKEYYNKELPFDEWKNSQTAANKEKGDDFLKRKYDREIDGAVFDVARFLLPQCIKTNIAWIADARSIEYDIAAWKAHPLAEIRDFAVKLEENAGQIAPSLLKYTEKSDYYGEKYSSYGKDIPAGTKLEKGVNILSYDPDALNKVIAHLLHDKGRGSFSEYLDDAKNMSYSEKLDLLKEISEKRGRFDEWIEVEETFDMVKVTAEIITDLGAVRDLRRHQKNDRIEPIYSLDCGYNKPAIVDAWGAGDKFDEAMNAVHEAELTLRKKFPFQTQYILPMATNHSLVMSMGLDQLQYLIATRSTPEGNFSYRQDMMNLTEEICKIYPWLLGYEKYPAGKTIKQVYADAPLKNLIRLNTEETRLHQ